MSVGELTWFGERMSRAVVVLAVAGALGLRVGMVGFPEWQVAVETAQVTAGLVAYPPANPFFVYHIKLWTVLHQILAVFLRAGVSEATLSLVLSGVLGMVAFQALSMSVYALSRDALLAIGAPIAISVARAAEIGVVYPNYLMGVSHTYGVLGLSLLVLATALMGAECYRAGCFLLGLAPAIHPSLGVWLVAIVAGTCVWDLEQARIMFRSGWKCVAAGCAISASSLALQLGLRPALPPVGAATANLYLTTFVRLWDGHRQPIEFGHPGVLLNATILALCLFWICGFGAHLSRSARFFLRTIIVTALLSLLLVFVSWVPPERLPPWLLILMPGRLLNVSAFIAFAVLLGLAGSEGARGRLVALSICIALLLNERSRMWEWVDAHVRAGGPRLNLLLVFWIGSTALIGAAGLSSAWMRRSTTGAASVALRIADGTLRLALIGTFLIGGVPIWRVARVRSDVFRDRTNDALFRTAALSPGLLLTGANLHLVQLRTRHPVLLDGGGLDGLPYALESGPAMQQILLDVYGLDLFDPPAEARRTGQIPPRANRAVWEQYSLEKWQQIGRTYNVSDVLVDAHWSLALPVVARNNDFTLYRIADAWTR